MPGDTVILRAGFFEGRYRGRAGSVPADDVFSASIFFIGAGLCGSRPFLEAEGFEEGVGHRQD